MIEQNQNRPDPAPQSTHVQNLPVAQPSTTSEPGIDLSADSCLPPRPVDEVERAMETIGRGMTSLVWTYRTIVGAALTVGGAYGAAISIAADSTLGVAGCVAFGVGAGLLTGRTALYAWLAAKGEKAVDWT